jgi:predicted Fe-Mo cluster-binding NifX family protein
MNSKKLLKKLGDFFDMDKKKRQKNAKELKSLLKLLKEEEKNLVIICQNQSPQNKKSMLKREIDVLHARRKKGLKALKKLIN